MNQRYSTLTMRLFALLLIAFSLGLGTTNAIAQAKKSAGSTPTDGLSESQLESALNSLKEIDKDILQYFPRWYVCEPNLQVQIMQTFKLNGRPKERLDMNRIIVTAQPNPNADKDPYTILLVECGEEKFVASEVDAYMKKLRDSLANVPRNYCYREIPITMPPTAAQSEAITNYFTMPTNVEHSISVSAFEQSLKLGKSGFWIRSVVGTDQVGYHFWSSGESKVILQRPLYDNFDPETNRAIPHLINARLGIGYRLRGGLENRLLSFIPERKLNSMPGKAIFGADIHAPFAPQFGLNFNIEVPLGSIDTAEIAELNTWARYDIPQNRRTILQSNGIDVNQGMAQVLRTTGQVTFFYNWWLNERNPENFFRFDLGVNYTEFGEFAFRNAGEANRFKITDQVRGLNSRIGLREFQDWIYAKVEYRSQSSYPFGVSAQYSNQILFMHAYFPLLGQWLYLEGKYSTPLRTANPWEVPNFFMVSPVIRMNIR
jgi:hypothetical protein